MGQSLLQNELFQRGKVISIVGLDPANRVFQLHAASADGGLVSRRMPDISGSVWESVMRKLETCMPQNNGMEER